MNHIFHTIRKPFFWTSLLVLVMLALAACQPAAAPTQAAPTMAPAPTATSAPAPTATTAAAQAPATEAEVDIATDPKLGQILVDSKGMTLYAFTKDVADKSNCAAGCLKAWPPLLSMGSPKAGTGVDQSMLGTATLEDGSKIVTYNHMPLYLWAKDQKAGDITGQNVNSVWFVVSPQGQMVKTDTTVPATGGTSSTSSTMLNVATDAKLGKILVDGKGMTLYMFKKDTTDKSNCAEGCLKAWPPFVANGNVTAGAGVDQSMIGTATLADGTKIVTYNHMPLYYFAKDQKVGDATGQDVNQVWYVVSPDGKVVEDESSSMDSTPAASAPAAGDVMVKLATDAKLGKILVDGKGMTLYMFTKDMPDKSNCAAGCLKAWPPFVASSAPKAGDGVDQSMLGTTTLADGSKIVTYNHMPLYYWAGDVKAGDTSGQNVNNVWFVVGPDGKPIGQ
jgi:predicted lipoprotein with Yx(FWY)xxD motif